MITTKIQITPYLAEYLFAKMNNYSFEAFSIPDDTDLYHLIWTLMSRRPAGLSPIDKGNVEIILPNRRAGKNPLYFNYISPKSQRMIARNVKAMFDLELHDIMNQNVKNGRPLRDVDVVHQFLCDYGIDSISEDALVKNYYRWREKFRKHSARNARNVKK